MSDDVLSRILILLDADSSRFTQEVNRTEAVADTSFSKIRDKANMMGVGLAAAAVAGAAALAALAAETIATSREIQNAAAVANISAERMQYYAVGAKQLGIEQDALGDILADTAEKMGEFAATEGGGLADFFENIAGKTDLTAEAFMKLKPPEALIAMVTAAEKANLSYEQTRFYLESFASDSTRLLPLLKNGGEGFKAYGDAAQRAGAILDDDVIAGTNNLMAAQFLMEQQVKGLKNEIVSGVMPTLVQLGDAFTGTANDGVNLIGVSDIINGALKGIAQTAVGAVATVDLLGESLNKVSGWKGITKSFDVKDLYTPGGIINMFKKASIAATVARSDEFGELGKKVEGYAAILEKLQNPKSSQDNVAALAKFMDTKGNIGAKAAEEAAKTSAAASAKAASAADAAAKAIQQAYDNQASGLQRQIELIGKTTELDKIRYELEQGSLAKLAPLQKQKLENLAAILDAKNREAAFKGHLENLQIEYNLTNIKFELDKHMYQLEQTKYKDVSDGERAQLLQLETSIKVKQDYLGLTNSLKNSEEQRYDSLSAKIEVADNRLKEFNRTWGESAAASADYANKMQAIFDSQSILPSITSGISDQSGIDAARTELENKYLLEQSMREQTISDKALLNDSLIALELDYQTRVTAIQEQADAVLAAKKKAEQDRTVSFFNKGLDAMANSSEKYAKTAKRIQQAQALYQIGIDTKAAAIGAYKAVVGIPIIGPTMAPIAAAAAIAFGLAQAKAVMSEGNSATATPSTPSTASTTVTPVADQPSDISSAQTTTIAIPADTLFTGRQMVDLLNDAIADGKRLDASAISFIGN